MRIVIATLLALAACAEPDEVPDDDPPPVGTRDDLTPCDERDGPVVESLDDPYETYVRLVDVPLCPGDQLAIRYRLGNFSYATVLPHDGLTDGIQVFYDPDDAPLTEVMADEEGARFTVPPNRSDPPCDGQRRDLLILADPDRAPTHFDLVPVDYDSCSSEG